MSDERIERHRPGQRSTIDSPTVPEGICAECGAVSGAEWASAVASLQKVRGEEELELGDDDTDTLIPHEANPAAADAVNMMVNDSAVRAASRLPGLYVTMMIEMVVAFTLAESSTVLKRCGASTCLLSS